MIDTEIAIGMFKKHKFNIVNNPENADIIIVNTCGFIDSAKEEAINTIIEMGEYKNKKCKYLIVMGCLVQRYYSDLIKELPEVDLFIKLDEYDNFWNKINDLIENRKVTKSKHNKNPKISEIPKMPMPKMNEFFEREITTGKNYAYLKIGEGCSNKCTYCAIPYIRGPFVSRPMEDIIEEAKILAKKGIKELIVIAQDTTKYGVDIYGESKLAELLHKLSKIDSIKWIRFLYSYPEGITDELIEEVCTNKKICKYFDIPIQHISNKVLKRMNRQTTKENIKNLIEKIRSKIPNVTLRTSLIVGFPGETQEQFHELYNFVEKTKFDKLGVFEYSKEEGTPAEKLPEQIDSKTKKQRFNQIMKLQQKISNEIMSKKVGNIVEVIIENISSDKRYFIGRTSSDVPDIDGVIYVKNDNSFGIESKLNNIDECEVIDYLNYDLFGKFYKPRVPLTWIGAVLSKDLYATWNDKHNQIRIYLDGENIAVYDVDVMNPIEDPILFLNNSIANELSANIKEKIQMLARGIDLERLKEVTKNNRREQDAIIKALGIQRINLRSYTEINLDEKVGASDREKDNETNTQNMEERFKQKEKLATTKDINIKQELQTSAMATSMKTIGQVMERAGKMPKVEGKNFTKLGIVESDRVKDIDKDAKTNTTRFSIVAIANDGSVVPLNLEQDKQEGNNPREISYRINADGRVEQDDVNSRFVIGNSGETISVKHSNGPGDIEVGYSARKTKGINGIEGNVSIDHQLKTKSVYWTPRKDSREQEYADGIYGADNRAKEAEIESTHNENLKAGKKGIVDRDDNYEYKNVDGDMNTKDQDHYDDIATRAKNLMEKNKDVANSFTEEEVKKMLEDAHNKGENLDSKEEDIEQDAEMMPSRNK